MRSRIPVSAAQQQSSQPSFVATSNKQQPWPAKPHRATRHAYAPVFLMAGTNPVVRLGRGWALTGDQNCQTIHTVPVCRFTSGAWLFGLLLPLLLLLLLLLLLPPPPSPAAPRSPLRLARRTSV